LYASPNVIQVIKSRRMRRGGYVAHNILVGKPEGKRPLGRPSHRWEDNIRTDLRETGWEDVNWFHLAQDSDQWQVCVNMEMNFQVP
jgi:hypothetical protein